MPTFANDVNGNQPKYYVAVTLTNSQSGATGTNFQCSVNVNSNTYSSYEAANLKNLNWQDGSGTIIKSWLESGETNSSTSTIYWLLLPASIAGSGGTQTVYLVFYDTTATSKDNTTTGAEPNYTGTYGQYDNGANIFTSLYQNFSGTTTPTGWTNSGGVTQNNGLVYSVGTNGGIVTTSTYGADATKILDFLINSNGTPNGACDMGTGFTPNNSRSFLAIDGNGGSGQFAVIDTGFAGLSTAEFPLNTWFVVSMQYNGTSSFVQGGYGSTVTASSATTTTNIGMYNFNNGAATALSKVQWFRLRVYPPSNVMPSSSFGSITPTRTQGSANIQSAATLHTNAYSMGVGNIASSATFSTNALAPGAGNISSIATVLSTIPLTTPSAGISSSVMVYINNPIASSAGVGTINMTVAIPFNSPIIPKTSYTAAFMATYLPPQTNVQSVNASSSNSITLTQTLSISASYLSPTLTTTVTDGQGHNIPNAIVSWSVIAGAATVSPASAITNGSGQATTTVTGTSSTVKSSVTLIGVTKTTTTSV